MSRLLVVASLLVSLFPLSTFAAAPLHLSVAASMTNAVEELVALYQQQHPDSPIRPNFASSGALAKQIAQGAPADLFISANPRWMQYLLDEELIAPETVTIVAGNRLVVVGEGAPLTALSDLAPLSRIAIASPKSAPAGRYAQQALEAAGIWKTLVSRMVMAKDVRQALAYTDRGEVAAAFVYKTDALLATQAKIILDVPQSLYPPVQYPMALTLRGARRPEGVAFYAFLQSAAAQEVLARCGFSAAATP
ncbi:MAG: molybdate ABC transporter substrate-binding protein [Desulfuromonas sp.]|nr:MAG: molybdate ABC transporter substrate-binding protein [Desulfuromonas sp.]